MRWKTQHGVVALPAILLFLCGGVQLVCGVRVDDVDDVNGVYGATAVNSDATEVEEADTKAAEKHPIALAEAVATAASAVRSVATAVVTAVTKATVAPEALPLSGTSLVLRTFGVYQHVHKVHHKSYNTGPWTGLAMHPVEQLLFFSSVLIPVAQHPLHFYLGLFHKLIAPLAGHDGFADPGGDGYFHFLHHKHFEVNFGSPAVPLDKLFGSFSDGSEFRK